MTWADYLDVADFLLTHRSGDAASMRSVISRAYYAAYNPTQEYVISTLGIRQRGTGGGRKSEHTIVPSAVRGCPDDAAQELADLLEDLKDRRHDADYRLGARDAESSDSAQAAVLSARQILKNLDACKALPDQNTVKSQMQAVV